MSEPDGGNNFERLLAAFLRDDLAPAGPTCPPAGLTAAYYEGKLIAEEARDLEEHLARCASCQADVATLARLDSAPEGKSEPIPSPVPIARAVPPVETQRHEDRIEPEAPGGGLEEEPAPPGRERLRVDEVAAEPDKPNDERSLAVGAADAGADDVQRAATLPIKLSTRRSSWKWVAPIAIAATAILAVSVTRRFAPLIEEARRKSSEPSTASPTAVPPGDSVGSAEYDREQLNDETAAADRIAPPEPRTRADEAPPSRPSSGLWSSPATAGHVPTAAAPPAAPSASGGRAEASSAMARQQAKKDGSTRMKVMGDQAAASALAAAPKPAVAEEPAHRAVAIGPVVVIARTNLDAAWRLSGNGIERSDDGGKTWRAQTSFTGAALLAGSAPSADICWVAGRGGVVLRTNDGEHWERLLSPTQDDLVQITAWNESSATVKSASGARFSTKDGGQTWSRL